MRIPLHLRSRRGRARARRLRYGGLDWRGYGVRYVRHGYGSGYYGNGYGYGGRLCRRRLRLVRRLGSPYYGGYGYGSPYFGWYSGYYYPGTGHLRLRHAIAAARR